MGNHPDWKLLEYWKHHQGYMKQLENRRADAATLQAPIRAAVRKHPPADVTDQRSAGKSV